jgi:predicted phage baseplate assembly protein
MTFESRRGRIVPPNLDDRTWQDLVDEMRALIPRYAPQWTDHNPSDLGISLIELFAWLAEGVIYRLNQTPEKHYLAFLNLLGITRDPPTPAHTYLTFTSGAGVVQVPAGTQAHTAAPEGETPITFETDEDVSVLPTNLEAVLAVGPYPSDATSGQYDDLSATLVGPPVAKHLLTVPPAAPPKTQSVQLCLGLDRKVAEEIVLGVHLYLPVADGAPVSVSWSYSRGAAEPLAWPAVTTAADATDSLRHDGSMRLTIPGDWEAQRPTAAPGGPPEGWSSVTARDPAHAFTDELFWIGLRITNPAATPLTVGIDRVLFNAAPARTALTIRSPEDLGQSTGEPFQVFQLRNRPLFRRPGLEAPYGHLEVQVGSGTPPTWKTWTQVEDFPPGEGEFYRVEPVVGEISFGNFDSQTGSGRGSVPPVGSLVRASSYRYVDAGSAGNVAPGKVVVLGTTPAGPLPSGISSVINLGPGLDGSDEEPIEDTLRRGPEQLKIRDRAVTADDYEFLAREASGDVRITRCLEPRLQASNGPTIPPLNTPAWVKGDPWTFAGLVRAPGNVNLIIVPDQGTEVPRPEPTQDQIRLVRMYLEQRRDLGALVDVKGPRYLPVIVNVELVVWQEAITAGADVGRVRADTLDRIRRFLHPTRGGPGDQGWAVGQPVFTSDLFRAIMPPQDLGYIASLQVRPDIPAYHFPPINPAGTPDNFRPDLERPFPLSPFSASVRLADYELVCAAADAAHVIKTTPLSI